MCFVLLTAMYSDVALLLPLGVRLVIWDRDQPILKIFAVHNTLYQIML